MRTMTGNELRNWRHSTSPIGNNKQHLACMPQSELASVLGISRNTVARWESFGDGNVPNWVPMALIGIEATLTQYFEEVNAAEEDEDQREIARIAGIDDRKAGTIEPEVRYEA